MYVEKNEFEKLSTYIAMVYQDTLTKYVCFATYPIEGMNCTEYTANSNNNQMKEESSRSGEK